MRRSLSIIAAAAITVGASAASLSSTEAAVARPTPVASDSANGAIIEVQRWENFHGDRHNSFRDDGWNDGRRHYRRHQRFRHQGFYRNQPFYFGFPFAFRPRYYPYNSYDNCFRAWDGRVICR